jgi:aryl-alcohol dehydrogenase-like predicted oxidoreductase
MQTRRRGKSTLDITPVGFGAWAIGGSGWEFAWGPQDDAASIAAIHRALELGVNWIDTAAVYGMGHAEEVVARVLATWSGPRPYVFTKGGLRWDERGQVDTVLKADSIRRECEDRLRRLHLEVIDLYQIHWPAGRATETDEGWATMVQLQREGKVRCIGVSNCEVEPLQRAQAMAPLTSLQPPYALIRREIAAEILPCCQRQGLGVIVYSPMASGLLTGAMTHERAANLATDDWRRRDPEFNEPTLSQTLALVERLRAVGGRYSRSPGEVAIAWTLRHPAVTGAIVGARSAKQVEGVMGAGDFRLSQEEIAAIEGGLDYRTPHGRPQRYARRTSSGRVADQSSAVGSAPGISAPAPDARHQHGPPRRGAVAGSWSLRGGDGAAICRHPSAGYGGAPLQQCGVKPYGANDQYQRRLVQELTAAQGANAMTTMTH